MRNLKFRIYKVRCISVLEKTGLRSNFLNFDFSTKTWEKLSNKHEISEKIKNEMQPADSEIAICWNQIDDQSSFGLTWPRFFLFPVTFCQIGLYFDELHFNSETIFEPCLFFRQEKNISEASKFYFPSKHGSPVQTYIYKGKIEEVKRIIVSESSRLFLY